MYLISKIQSDSLCSPWQQLVNWWGRAASKTISHTKVMGESLFAQMRQKQLKLMAIHIVLSNSAVTIKRKQSDTNLHIKFNIKYI